MAATLDYKITDNGILSISAVSTNGRGILSAVGSTKEQAIAQADSHIKDYTRYVEATKTQIATKQQEIEELSQKITAGDASRETQHDLKNAKRDLVELNNTLSSEQQEIADAEDIKSQLSSSFDVKKAEADTNKSAVNQKNQNAEQAKNQTAATAGTNSTDDVKQTTTTNASTETSTLRKDPLTTEEQKKVNEDSSTTTTKNNSIASTLR